MIIQNQATGQTLNIAIPWSGMSLPHGHLNATGASCPQFVAIRFQPLVVARSAHS
jgi:hypothetical protein